MKYITFITFFIITTTLFLSSCNNEPKHSTDVTTNTSSPVNNDNNIKLAADEMYTCQMHNEVLSDHPGKCPKCEMKLVKQKMTDKQKQLMKEGNYLKPTE